jgi:hypothetical protein
MENWKVLNNFNFNLSQALQVQQNSLLNFSSEFKDLHILSTIMDDHPLWDFTSEILANGASYPLKDIPKDIRTTEFQFFINHGNHKSALINNTKVQELLLDDVIRGFSLILPFDAAHHLKGISQELDTINDRGEIINKNDLTHDQSFPDVRVQFEKLPQCKFGHCLKRIINYIISIRSRHPTTPIFLSKFDFDAAYRCCHLSPQSALESCSPSNIWRCPMSKPLGSLW